MKPCPFCGCKTTGLKGSEPNIQMVCTGCGAEGPSSSSASEADIRWSRRPDTEFWQKIAAYFGSVHAANGMEYHSKSVSRSRRDRQIGILKIVVNALLLGQLPEKMNMMRSADQMIKDAGERAEGERQDLLARQKELE